jgi:hypothetical protein
VDVALNITERFHQFQPKMAPPPHRGRLEDLPIVKRNTKSIAVSAFALNIFL